MSEEEVAPVATAAVIFPRVIAVEVLRTTAAAVVHEEAVLIALLMSPVKLNTAEESVTTTLRRDSKMEHLVEKVFPDLALVQPPEAEAVAVAVVDIPPLHPALKVSSVLTADL